MKPNPDKRPQLDELLRRANAVSAANRRYPRTSEIFRRVRWLSEPDREADAAPLTHLMRCDACGQSSPKHIEFGLAQDWQLDHAAFNPTHLLYTETLTRPWRARMETGPSSVNDP